MQSSDLLEPTKPQLEEEKLIIQELDKMKRQSFRTYSAYTVHRSEDYDVLESLVPILQYFTSYSIGLLGDRFVNLRGLRRKQVDVMGMIPNTNTDLFMEIEGRRTTLYRRVSNPSFSSYIQSLTTDEMRYEFFIISILLIHYWLLSTKLYKNREPSLSYLKAHPELKGSLSVQYWLFLKELYVKAPQQYAKIQQNISLDDMGRIPGGKEQLQLPVPTPATILNQRLVRAGAYEQLSQFDPRRAAMLQTYLTTEKPALDVGREVGINSRSRATELLHSAMELAFFALPEQERAEYDNSPAAALQTRSKQQTKTKGERVSQAHNRRPKNEDGKIAISDTQRDHMKQGATRRWRRYHEAKAQAAPDQ